MIASRLDRPRPTYTESQRAEVWALVKLASELIPPLWPLRTAIAVNPLVGLEELDFEDAIRRTEQYWGGRGYLDNSQYRDYYRQGRITDRHVEAVLSPLVQEDVVVLGSRRISHREALRAHFVDGITAPAQEALEALIDNDPERPVLESLADRLRTGLRPETVEALVRRQVQADRQALGHHLTLAGWCDRTLGTQLSADLDGEMIRWCSAYLDEGQAAWPMPRREETFFGAWKHLGSGALDGRLRGIPDQRAKLAALADRPEDAILQALENLGLPRTIWLEYLSRHLTRLPGWAGYIRWRAEQPDPVSAEWARAFPVDLVQYLAVRLWNEQELVEAACGARLGFEGTYGAMSAYMQRQPTTFWFRREWVAGRLTEWTRRRADRLAHGWPAAGEEQWHALAAAWTAECEGRAHHAAARGGAWRLRALAKSLDLGTTVLLDAPPEALRALLGWLDGFPESQHGPRWLKALEAGYDEHLLNRLTAHRQRTGGATPAVVRPLAQAVFCIDVRSECFRRHLEEIGGYETLGFAGFFICFIRYRGLDRRHDVNSFPVIMKAKNVIREIPRSAHAAEVPRYRAGAQFIRAIRHLLHDLKEHVITPYVMVESLGWFYNLPFIGKALVPIWFKRASAWLRDRVTSRIATTLTVDKLPREEVGEMLAAEQRAVIRRALRERFNLSGSRLSPELVESLRLQALGEQPATQSVGFPGLPERQQAELLQALREEYRIGSRWMGTQMAQITQTGLTLEEQVVTVGLALRMMGLTGNFARLVVFVAHGSTMDNNPHESAYECGACGGNDGNANTRLLAAMGNKPQVREQLKKNGLFIPEDTYFLGGQVDTCTDDLQLFDLEDVPATHRKDLHRFLGDVKEAGLQTSCERLALLPDVGRRVSPSQAAALTLQRSTDWSQVRPEWGLAGNAAVVVGRRQLTQGLDLEGRVFLHSYDWREDPELKALEIILTAPGQVMEWINLGYYFSTVDNDTFGAGNKIYHNVVGRLGVMLGTQSDLRLGLPRQSIMDGDRPYHEPMRLLLIVEAPRERIDTLIRRHPILQRFYRNRWVRLVNLEPAEGIFYRYHHKDGWERAVL